MAIIGQLNEYEFENVQPNKIALLKKWNKRLILKEPSMFFVKIILDKDPNKGLAFTRREWFNELIQTKDSFLNKPSSDITEYIVQTQSGRDLLVYYIKDVDTLEFERDMKFAWTFLEKCYDKDWWLKEYGNYSSDSPLYDLFLERRKTVIG